MSLILTELKTAVIRANDDFNKFENRTEAKGVLEAFMKYRERLVPVRLIEDLKTSFRRPIEIPTLKSQLLQVGTVRAIAPPRDEAASDMVPLNWITRTFAFKYTYAINRDNYISTNENLAQMLLDGFKSVYFRHSNSVEKYLINYLESIKYSNLPTSNIYGVATNADSYSTAQNDYVINAPVIMNELMMEGPFTDITTVSSTARQRQDATYGVYNQRNVEQYAKELEYFKSHHLPVEAGFTETHFLSPAGSLALISTVEDDAKVGRLGDDGHFTRISDPILGLPWGVRITNTVQDNSAIAVGFERTMTATFDFAIDLSAVSAYSSDADASAVVKVETTAV